MSDELLEQSRWNWQGITGSSSPDCILEVKGYCRTWFKFMLAKACTSTLGHHSLSSRFKLETASVYVQVSTSSCSSMYVYFIQCHHVVDETRQHDGHLACETDRSVEQVFYKPGVHPKVCFCQTKLKLHTYIRSYVRTYVHPQKSFFSCNEIWHVCRGQWVMHDSMSMTWSKVKVTSPCKLAHFTCI